MMATPSSAKNINTPKNSAIKSSLKQVSAKSTSKVRVVVRIRPFLGSEVVAKDQIPVPCISVLNLDHDPSKAVAIHIKDQETSRNECYKLDSFFGQGENVGLIFEKEVLPLIPEIFLGNNATVFAYGATGSGKTYTMQGRDQHPGLMSLAMSTIFSMREKTSSSVEISYYEVYLDRCYDLLEPKAKEIAVLEDREGRVQLKGLSKVSVHTMDEFHEILSTGVQRRKVAHNGLNDVSSRSHGVLMATISSFGADSTVNFTGKLNLIDLAGNEDNRRTCNEGIRMLESAKINQSLFALSNVIHALSNNEPRVPYRESKLTRILQDSLGGTSRALMIACLNPVSYQEAIHTVSLAARSRQIANFESSTGKQESIKERVDMKEKLRAWLESKGKARGSAQRIHPPFSPLFGRTPLQFNSEKKSYSCQSSLKKTPLNGGTTFKGRKLFESGDAVATIVKEKSSQQMEMKGLTDAASHKDVSTISTDNAFRDDSSSFYDAEELTLEETPFHRNNEESGNGHARDDSELFVPSKILQDECFRREDMMTPSYRKDEENGNEKARENSKLLIPPVNSQDECKEKENILTPTHFINSMGSLSMSEKNRVLSNSLTKALSPVHSDINTISHNDISSTDQASLSLLDPKTPKTPYFPNCNEEENLTIALTPLDKFHARSSSLKISLMEEYLEFLNIASREELLALKGIGQKRANYIIELREQTPRPLKSLSDLEEIGLSSKQVHNMFTSTTREIFKNVP